MFSIVGRSGTLPIRINVCRIVFVRERELKMVEFNE